MSELSSAGSAPRAPGATGVQALAPKELKDVTLTAQRPLVANQAYVRLVLPYSTNPETGVVTYDPHFPGAATVYMKAAKGASYLVEIALASTGNTKLDIRAGETDHQVSIDSSPQNLLYGVQATEAGWVSLRLKPVSGSRFDLHQVRVTRVP